MNAPAQLSLDDLLRSQLLDEFEQVKADLEFAYVVDHPGEYGLGVNDVRYLTGPIVQFTAGWPFPSMLRKFAPAARLELVLSGEKSLCTLEESLGYLSTLSLAGPLDREYAEVMFWLSQEVLSKHGGADDVYKILGFSKPVELSDYQEAHILNRLRADIRRSVVKGAKGRAKK
jgi:hypothetical protein